MYCCCFYWGGYIYDGNIQYYWQRQQHKILPDSTEEHTNTFLDFLFGFRHVYTNINLIPKSKSTVPYRYRTSVEMFHFLSTKYKKREKENARIHLYIAFSLFDEHKALDSHCHLPNAIYIMCTYRKPGIKRNLFYVINVVRCTRVEQWSEGETRKPERQREKITDGGLLDIAHCSLQWQVISSSLFHTHTLAEREKKNPKW